MNKKRPISRLRATLRGRYWREQLLQIRHCYRCGGKLELCYVKEEECNRRRCTKCGTITYTNPKVVAGCIPVMPDGRLLLLERDIEPARGKWTYPAGYMEMRETVEAAAARETMEEIGVRVKIIREVGVYSYHDAGVVTIVYEGRVLRGEKPVSGRETADFKLVRPDEINWKELAFRSTAHALKDWLTWRKKA
jgi:ADP-ribose pyrophosphatase YjhB (NUDIX family)